MKWIKVTKDEDFPEFGKLIVVCMDHGDWKSYNVVKWNRQDLKFWKLNSIVGWVYLKEYE